jgi:hypothetical protein
MSSVFMCVSINPQEPDNHGCPIFFQSILEANRYALDNAKTSVLNVPMIGIYNKRVTMCVCIFKIPFGRYIPIYGADYSSIDDEIWDFHERTIWDRQTRAARLIQEFYRERFELKKSSAILIQKVYREAIANPYTQLCRNRLLHEFEDMYSS